MEIFNGIILNMQAPAYATIYSPQGQTLSRSVRAQLLDGATEWAIPETALLTIRYAKPDGTIGFYDTLEDGSSAYSYSGNVVTFGLAAQALTVPGDVMMQLDFYSTGGEKISTFTFRLVVAEGVFSDDVITSSDYFNVLTATMTEVAEIFHEIKAAYGAPLTANTAAAMTDTDRVYVYTGTTGGGFTNGHWYYWNGSAWTDGGVYNSAALETDKTLSIDGMAADAKATGAVMHNLRATNIAFLDEIVKSSVNYDATRINNGQTVDSTTGDAYEAVGRCMTNVLNGTAYPMDAVYIDSTDYCIRLFGYSAQPVTASTYIGCTDYITGGKGNVLYRDPSWNVCRMVIARNPITDYTAFTTAEIEDIAAKLNLLKFADLQDEIQQSNAAINAVDSKTNYSIGAAAGISSYSFSDVGHYDSSRLNNDKTLAGKTGGISPGAMIDAPGRCVTNTLNGSLYQMDGVYIDSDAYCIRLFGFEGPTTDPAYFIDCTDFETGGAKKILYRDPSWNICRVVIARNPLTDTTSFTSEELQDIAEKLNLIKYIDLQPEIANQTSKINYAIASIADVGNYVFDYVGHYDATRINNGQTVDSTTGDAYEAVGRCMTNVLNGTLYPMDAVYIDSTDYCIRLFGYSAQPVTAATYLGCTDYISGGRNNILYRDPAWNICRIVIARNPTTDSTAFTTAEIEDIAEKLNLLKKQDKSIDTDYLDYRLLGLHTIPQNVGVLNVIKRARQLTDMKWTSEINIPRVSMIDSDNYDSPANYVDDVFLANTEYTGVPYSSRNFVGTNVGINSFVTAMYNSQRSTMKDSAKVDRDTAAMYGTVCCTLTSYALKLPIVASGYYHQIPDLVLIGTVPSTVDDMQLGDVIIETSHTALITDIIRENNIIKYVEVSESTKHGLENADKQGMQWGGICRRKLWAVGDYVRWFGNFSLYRYSKIASVPYNENEYVNIGDGLGFRKNPYLACMPYEGDYYHYSRTLTNINVIILDTHYTSLVVYKDGTELATYPITAQTESVTVTLDGGGYYTANLLDGNNHASGSCHWMVNTTTDISYTVANGTASFTVKRDLDTPPISVRFNKVYDNPVYSYHIHPVDNLQKSFVNNQFVYTFTVPYDVETVQDYYVYLDAWDYGIIVIDRTVG